MWSVFAVHQERVSPEAATFLLHLLTAGFGRYCCKKIFGRGTKNSFLG